MKTKITTLKHITALTESLPNVDRVKMNYKLYGALIKRRTKETIVETQSKLEV